MRHQRKTVKLGRSQSHRDALLANQVISLIQHERIKTTLAKAKAVRPFAEKLVTIGRKNTLHARRLALAYLFHNQAAVRALFEKVAPRTAGRNGGYTRIIKLGSRNSDSSEMALLEWVDKAPEAPAAAEVAAPSQEAQATT
jgi:large subunit ribosomal protein L17